MHCRLWSLNLFCSSCKLSLALLKLYQLLQNELTQENFKPMYDLFILCLFYIYFIIKSTYSCRLRSEEAPLFVPFVQKIQFLRKKIFRSLIMRPLHNPQCLTRYVFFLYWYAGLLLILKRASEHWLNNLSVMWSAFFVNKGGYELHVLAFSCNSSHIWVTERNSNASLALSV